MLPWICLYLMIGLAMGEGLIYCRKKGYSVSKRDYIICIFLGPAATIVVIIAWIMKNIEK